MNYIISAFDIINELACCDNALKKCAVDVAYENDTTRYNAVIFVRDNLIINGTGTFSVNVRGDKNDGESTTQIARELLKYNSMYQELCINGELYCIRFWFSNVFGAGADDTGRTIIALDVQVQISKD